MSEIKFLEAKNLEFTSPAFKGSRRDIKFYLSARRNQLVSLEYINLNTIRIFNENGYFISIDSLFKFDKYNKFMIVDLKSNSISNGKLHSIDVKVFKRIDTNTVVKELKNLILSYPINSDIKPINLYKHILKFSSLTSIKKIDFYLSKINPKLRKDMKNEKINIIDIA